MERGERIEAGEGRMDGGERKGRRETGGGSRDNCKNLSRYNLSRFD